MVKRIYIPSGMKDKLWQILGKHFAPDLLKRFQLLYETEIYNPKKDRSLWKDWKAGVKTVEVYFDSEFLCDISEILLPIQAEIKILKAFKDAYAYGRIRLSADYKDEESPDVRKREDRTAELLVKGKRMPEKAVPSDVLIPKKKGGEKRERKDKKGS